MGSLRIDDHVGRVLSGRYRLVAALGTGASAHVFVADDVTLRRRVAVKVLHQGLADEPAFLRRFRAEAQAVAALRHPNIVAVYDWGEDADTPFLVCELLEGGSLRALLDTGYLLSPVQAAHVGLEASRGLDYAHRRGLVHRDVKPANLLFDDEGRLCVADFGVARALAETALTEPHGTVIGTARYASPEQVRGSRLDGRSDVYSLALVLIEAVTGQVPFAVDTTVGTLLARVGAVVDVPDSLGTLAPVIRRASTPDPADRIDAGELLRTLDELVRTFPRPDPLPILGPHARPRPVVPIDLRDRTSLPLLAPSAVFDQESTRGPHVEAVDAGEAGEVAWRRTRARTGTRRRWPVLVAVLALLAAGGGAAYAVVRNRVPNVAVPAVTHLSQQAAIARLQSAHLRARVVNQTYQDGTSIDEVLAAVPTGGQLKRGSTVDLVVSLGPTPVDIPNLTGKTLADATAALDGAGLKVGLVTPMNSDTVPLGQVIVWSPTGVQLRRGEKVDLTMSTGPQQVAVPDVVSTTKSFAGAQAALMAAGFKVAPEVDDFSNAVPRGQIISISPAAGTMLAKGQTVTVHVSKGPDVVTVPTTGIIQATAAAAQTLLVQAGLTPGFTYGPVTGRVFHTVPAPGTVVPRGTTVNLYTQ